MTFTTFTERLTLERASLITSLLVVLFLLVIGQYSRVYNSLMPNWERVSYISAQGLLETTSFPLVLPEQPMQVVVQAEFILPEDHPTKFFFKQDDCINSLYVNGLPIALPEHPYCDYNRGLSLDLHAAIHPGKNSLSLSLHNRGGPGGLKITPAGSDRFVRQARFVVIILSLLIGAILVVCWKAVTREELNRLRLPSSSRIGFEWAALAIALFGAMSIRWFAFPYESTDIRNFVRPWLEFILQHGKFSAHEFDFSNYAPLYLYLLSLFSPLVRFLPDIFVIKFISVLGDIVLALGVIRVVRELHPNGSRAECAGVITLFLPTVWLNSSMWGQVDALYTSALVWSFYYLLRQQHLLCSLCFGVALSFKLQALFLSPLFACGWALGVRSLWPLLLSPIFFVGSLLPAWLAGRPFLELLFVYGRQAGSYSELTKGAPTLYAWLPNHLYSLFYPMGMILALSVLALAWVILARSKRQSSPALLLLLAFAAVVVTPFLLPKMHDRYFYPADIFGLIVAFCFPNLFWLAILTQITSVASYAPFLLGQTMMHPHLIASLQLFIVVMAIVAVFRAVAAAPRVAVDATIPPIAEDTSVHVEKAHSEAPACQHKQEHHNRQSD